MKEYLCSNCSDLGCAKCPPSVPVAPAPTASAREWFKTYLTTETNLAEYSHFPVYVGQYDATIRLLEAYASSQSSKLEGVGQEAAEKIRARYLESIAAGVKHPGPDWLEVVAKGIIDELIAGRLK